MVSLGNALAPKGDLRTEGCRIIPDLQAYSGFRCGIKGGRGWYEGRQNPFDRPLPQYLTRLIQIFLKSRQQCLASSSFYLL